MGQSFTDRYGSEETWHGKVIVMEIFHLAMRHQNKDWTVTRTADYFGVSVGLASENLRLAQAIHQNDRIMKCETRKLALKKLNGSRI